MSNEERLQRLTEIARRVWPDADIQPHYGLGNKLRGYGAKATQAPYSDGITVWHPRSLDALEAALLVLDGKDEPLSLSQAKDAWSEGFEAAKRLFATSSVGRGLRAMQTDPKAELQRLDDELTPEVMQAIVAASTAVPAWIETVAREWEKLAERLAHDHEGADYELGGAAVYRQAAAELRERARQR